MHEALMTVVQSRHILHFNNLTLSHCAGGWAGGERERDQKKDEGAIFVQKDVNPVDKSYITLTTGRLFAFFRPAAIYLITLTASVIIYKIVLCRRQKCNTRSSAMGNYYVTESRLSLQSFANFGKRL